MKLKYIDKKCSIPTEIALIVYIMGVALTQIVEVATGDMYSLTKYIMLFLNVIIMIKVFTDRRIGKSFLLSVALLLCFAVFYYFIYKSMDLQYWGFVRAGVICAVMCLFIFRTMSFEKFSYWNCVEYVMLFYLLLNFGLYISKNAVWFGNEGNAIRYKGASDNPNLLATVMFVICLIEFWGTSKKAYLIKMMSLIIVILTGSRIYFALSVIVCLISLYATSKSCLLFLKKMLILTVFGIIGIIYIAFTTNLLDRFMDKGFSSNGRFYLLECGWQTVKSAELWEIFLGVGMSSDYWELSILTPTHSFAENSYLYYFMLFGFMGVVLIAWYIYYGINISNLNVYKMVFLFVLFSYFFQDTVSYVQGFVSVNGALMVIATDSRKPFVYKDAGMKSCLRRGI